MMRKIVAACLVVSFAVPAGAAQLYRWVDAQGRIEWRDTPPPADAKQVEQRKIQGNIAPSAALPYAVQHAAKNFPVTLWTTSCGALCDRAKSHLARRAVPYTEKDPKANADEFRQVTGGMEVPVLFVGRTQLKGYAEAEWDRALDSAGYPSPTPAP